MDLSNILQNNNKEFKSLFNPALSLDNTYFLDFSVDNPELADVNLTDTPSLDKYVFDLIKNDDKLYGYGGYMEDREIYRRSKLFSGSGEDSRSIHLGIDVWTHAGKEVYLPLPGVIHSFQNNTSHGDYGPTIIVEHELEGTTFFTLYGHLSLGSLSGLYEGMKVRAGQVLCRIGDATVNGDWPPHLHFQVISDMKRKKGDFPGVCFKDEVKDYQKICPDPVIFFPKLKE